MPNSFETPQTIGGSAYELEDHGRSGHEYYELQREALARQGAGLLLAAEVEAGLGDM